MKPPARNYSLNAMLVMLGLIAILLILQAIIRYNDFVNNQIALMENEVEIGGKEVERLVDELHTELAIFAEEKYEIINFLAAYPDSEDISKHIKEKVAALFPAYTAIIISDENAITRYYSGKKEGDIICLEDISRFLENAGSGEISIHESNGSYHFDVMSPWGRTRTRGVITVSFNPAIIARSLQISESPDHKLLLLHKDKPGLVEISATGARSYPGDTGSAQLTGETLGHIGARYDVKGTRWQLVAYTGEHLYGDQLHFILIQTLTVMLAVGVVSFIMLRVIIKTSQQRQRTEEALYAANEHLQQALDFSEVLMCRWDTKTDLLIWSKNAKHLFGGYVPELFSHYLRLIEKDYRNILRDEIEKCLVTNEPYQNVHPIKLQDGSRRWIEMSGNFEVSSETGHIEVISLVTDVTERKHAENSRIQAEKNQRDTLVREVHHRIKNHLQGVVGLLRQHTVNHPEISDVIDMAAGQLHSVSTVYGLQSREMKSNVGVHELLVEICNANKGMLGAEIDYTAYDDNPSVALSEDRAVAIALVVNELMTNAIKHSDGAGGQAINVGMQFQDGMVTIEVTNKLETVPEGFDFEHGKGLGTGLTLIRSLLPGKGARLTIKPGQKQMEAILKLWSPVIRNDNE